MFIRMELIYLPDDQSKRVHCPLGKLVDLLENDSREVYREYQVGSTYTQLALESPEERLAQLK